MIEVLMYFSFIFTMLILLMKARFHPIGIDNTEQFEETFMSFMINKIIGVMVKKKFDESIIDKEIDVKMNEIVVIKLFIKKRDFKQIKNVIESKQEPYYVHSCDSIDWLERCTVGQITKFELDELR